MIINSVKIKKEKRVVFQTIYSYLNNKKIELDLFNYATNSNLKNEIGVHTSIFAKKADLASLKPNVEKLKNHKLKTTPAGVSKLS